MQADTLVRMANQIAAAFASLPREQAVGAVAEHLAAFWDPRMRRAIAAHAAAGGEGLTPNARDAVLSLNQKQT